MVDILAMPKTAGHHKENFFKDLTNLTSDRINEVVHPFPKLYTVEEVMKQKGKIAYEK